MKIDPKHLVTIEVVRREQSLTRAAAALETSQPALSRTLSDLEARIGAPLFDRTSRPWSLTRLGEQLARQGATVLRAQHRAAHEYEQFTTGGRETLRIIGPPFFTDGALSKLLAEFQNKHPESSIELSYGYGSDLRDAVTTGNADLAVYPVELGDLPADLTFTPLVRARNVIACRKGHPILKLAFPRPLALLDYGWVSPPDGSPLAADMASILEGLEMHEASIVMRGGSLSAVLNFVANSDCLTVLPEASLLSMGRALDLDMVPIETGRPRRPLGILSRPAAELGFTAHALVRFLEQNFTVPDHEDSDLEDAMHAPHNSADAKIAGP